MKYLPSPEDFWGMWECACLIFNRVVSKCAEFLLINRFDILHNHVLILAMHLSQRKSAISRELSGSERGDTSSVKAVSTLLYSSMGCPWHSAVKIVLHCTNGAYCVDK